MENKYLVLVAHEIAKATARQSKANHVACLKAHYLSCFLAAQAARKRSNNYKCNCCNK